MHFFILPNLVNAQKAPSSSRFSGLECVPPGKITIDFFKEATYVDPNNLAIVDWKIVIGQNFTYKGSIPSNGAWTWSVGGANKWNAIFTPKTVATNENEGIGIIPLTNMPLSNSDFGLSRGKVDVSNTLGENGKADVKVFFLKDDKSNPMKVPNWFYYWSQSPIIKSLLQIGGITMFDEKNCSWNSSPKSFTATLSYGGFPNNYPSSTTYGRNSFGIHGGLMSLTNDLDIICPPNKKQQVAIDYNSSFDIKIGDGCGFIKDLFYGGGSNTTLKGIHVFYSLVAHETEHMKLKCEIWQHTDPNASIGSGYSSIWDLDNDGYKDSWEDQIGNKLQITNSNLKNFNKNVKDTYSNGYSQALLGTGLYSAGTEYEEWRCYNVEAALIQSLIDVDDWSFDPKNVIQGKQWK